MTPSFLVILCMTLINFSSRDPYQTSRGLSSPLTGVIIFAKCENPMDSRYHLNISACFPNSSLSNSGRYIYVLLTWDSEYLGDLCQVEQMTLSSRYDLMYREDGFRNNISYTDFHNEQQGFELSWYRAYCGSCSYDKCYLDGVANNVTCYHHGAYKNASENNMLFLSFLNYWISHSHH
jgi:hypothetical protein